MAAAALLVAGCGGTGRHGSPPPPARRAAPLISILEAQTQLLADPASTAVELQRLGVRATRLFVSWASVAPDPTSRRRPTGFDASSPNAYPAAGWAPWDAIVRAAAARGITVDMTLQSPVPLWATAPGVPAGAKYAGSWRPIPADFGQFVHAIATRYSGTFKPTGSATPLPRVSFWSIWNEPNYGPTLAPQAVDQSTVEASPAIYRGLVDAAWRALQATGHGGDTILIGELAPRGITGPGFPGAFSGMVPLRFLRALYCVDDSLKRLQGAAATARGCPASGRAGQFAAAHPGLFDATGYALHLYPSEAQAPNVVAQDEPDYADLANVGRFESTIDRILSVYGSTRRFPIYDTEFGYKTNPPYPYGASMPTAAAYLNWSENLHWRDPRIRAYDQYLLVDPGPNSHFDTGVRFADGRPKPIYAAYRIALYLPITTAKSGSALEIWGCVRPLSNIPSPAARTAVLQFAPHGSGQFRDLRRIPVEDPNGYLDVRLAVPGSGTIRLAWSYPHGPTVFSRSVAVSIG